MKFFSPLALFAVLLTGIFAAPVEKALSERGLNFGANLGANLGGSLIGAIRDLETTVDGLSKRASGSSYTLGIAGGISGAIKRSPEGVHEELSKRTEDYTLVLDSLPFLGGLSGRSTDNYQGKSIMIIPSDGLVQALQQNGVTQEKIPQFVSQNLYATDPATGVQYQFIPEAIVNATVDIVLNLDYQPSS